MSTEILRHLEAKIKKSPKAREGLHLTDNEMRQLADSLLTHGNTWFSKGSARVFNSLLVKVRKEAECRRNKKSILRAMGDV